MCGPMHIENTAAYCLCCKKKIINPKGHIIVLGNCRCISVNLTVGFYPLGNRLDCQSGLYLAERSQVVGGEEK